MFGPSLFTIFALVVPSVLASPSTHVRPHAVSRHQARSIPRLLNLHPILHARQEGEGDFSTCPSCNVIYVDADKCLANLPTGTPEETADGLPAATECLCSQTFFDAAVDCFACTGGLIGGDQGATVQDDRTKELDQFRTACNTAGFPISGSSPATPAATTTAGATQPADASTSAVAKEEETESTSAGVVQGTATGATAGSPISSTAGKASSTTRIVRNESSSTAQSSASASAAAVVAATGGARLGASAMGGIAVGAGAVVVGTMLF